jgi:PIN domain nuclease of toxin-antitoxin system
MVVWKSSAIVSVATPPTSIEGFAPDDRGGPAPEDTVVAVLTGQDHVEEHALVVATGLEVLERVVIAEVVRSLDHGHLGIVEVAHRRVQDVGLRHVVGVEHEQDLAAGVVECVVDVARLGVLVGGAAQVPGTEPVGQGGHLGAVTVVEDPSRVRVGDAVAADEGGTQDIEALVVGADEHVDAGAPSDAGARPPGPARRGR